MRKIYFFTIIAIVCVSGACTKDTKSSIIIVTSPPATTVNTFDVFYDGKQYTGGVKYMTFGGALGGKYKSQLSAYENQDVNFNLSLTNVPDSGVVKTLCSSACDPYSGDTNLTFNAVEINLSEFTGTVERVGPAKIVINATKNSKPLTGFVQWK